MGKFEMLGSCDHSTYVRFYFDGHVVNGSGYSLVGEMTGDLMTVYVVPDVRHLKDDVRNRILDDLGIFCKRSLCLRHLVMHGEYSLEVAEFNCGGCVLSYFEDRDRFDVVEALSDAYLLFGEYLEVCSKLSYRIMK